MHMCVTTPVMNKPEQLHKRPQKLEETRKLEEIIKKKTRKN